MVAKPKLKMMSVLQGKQFTLECVKGNRRGQTWVFRSGTVEEYHAQGYHRLRISLKVTDLIEGSQEDCKTFMASVERQNFLKMEAAMDNFLRENEIKVNLFTFPKLPIEIGGQEEQFICRIQSTPEAEAKCPD